MAELILALDVPRAADAFALLDRLPELRWVKLGPRRFSSTSSGTRSRTPVHTLGGSTMLEAAAVAAGTELDLVGVTVLTSHDSAEYSRAVGRSEVDLSREVERQALVAARAGLKGVVCSPLEVSLLRRQLGPDLYIVVPGIRRRSDPSTDQPRVATAEDASGNGATHLAVGRPVLQAADPAAAFEEFMREARCGRS